MREAELLFPVLRVAHLGILSFHQCEALLNNLSVPVA